MTRLQLVLSKLDHIRASGGGYVARCPAHDDSNPSLSIREASDGSVLIKCFAGCATAEVLKALNLQQSDLAETIVYNYEDESGKVLYQKVRLPGKTFRCRRPNASGGYTYDLKGVKRVLYNLPGILGLKERIKNGDPVEPVFLVEGEKDADRLIDLGMTATTTDAGAGKNKPWLSSYTETLRDCHVVILPDQDQPGHDYALNAAKGLHGVALSVQIVNLPGLSEKGDVSDWLDAGGTKEAFTKAVLFAPLWSPDEAGDDAASPQLSLQDLNQRFAYCIVGNREAVLEEGVDPEGRPTLDFMSVEVFRGWHREHWTEVETDKGTKRVRVADEWLGWSGKRKYRHVEFTPPPLIPAPQTYNLFQGFAVEPAEGDCSLFLEHLKVNVCQGNEDHFRWVMSWLAHLFQKPAYKLGTALALRGKQGTGKSKVGEVLGKLLGECYFKASSPHQVTGNFNSHLKNCLLLQAEEAFWAGDKAAEGVLKDLITSDDLRVEFKGRDIIKMRNCIRLFVTSNAEWVVPASFDDRRFTVLDMGESRIRDHEFFGHMDEQMKRGGYAALLHTLLQYPVDEPLVRRNLDTQGGRDQKLRSLDPWESWVVDLINQGWLPGDADAVGETLVTMVQQDYVKHVQSRRGRHIRNNTEIGIHLPKWFPGLEKVRRTVDGKILFFYSFPPLSECRKAVLDRMPGLDVDWDMQEEWDPDPFSRTSKAEGGDTPF